MTPFNQSVLVLLVLVIGMLVLQLKRMENRKS
jgi:hypothetical protein